MTVSVRRESRRRSIREPAGRCVSVVLEGCAYDLVGLSEAFALEPENCSAIDESVDGGDGGSLGGKETLPLAEPGVCR